MTPLPLVVCVWNDAWQGDGPVALDSVREHHKPEVVTTIGWLLHQDEVGVSLANEFYGDTYRGRTFIYAPMLISVTPYTLVKPRKPRPLKPPAT
jgi:hypothetical protein